LVTRHGKEEDHDGCPTWPAGFYLGPPWLKVSQLVTKQSMILNLPVKGCKTKDNVSVQIDVAIVLRVMGEKDKPGDDPRNVLKFVHNVTAIGLQQQIMDAQAEAIRMLARSVNYTEVFGLRTVSVDELDGVREKLLNGPDMAPTSGDVNFNIPETIGEENEDEEEKEDSEAEKDMRGYHDDLDAIEAGFNVERGATVSDAMRARLNRQFKPQGIDILDVIIQQIILPHHISSDMSQKTMVISLNSEQRMQHKFDMMSLLQDEEVTTIRQAQDEQQMEVLQEGEFQMSQEKLALNVSKAEGNKELNLIKIQSMNDVGMVKAQSGIEVRRIYDASTLTSEKIKLEAESKSTKLNTEAKTEADIIRAKAEYECAVLQSTGDKVVFNAHGIAAPKIRQLRDFTTDQKKIAAQASLASNKRLVITGTSGGKAANKMLVADAALADIQNMDHSGLAGKARSDMLSEYAVSTGKAFVNLKM